MSKPSVNRNNYQQAFQALVAEAKAKFYERDDAVDAIALAILAAKHIFALGPPGTAKSLLVEGFAKQIIGAGGVSITQASSGMVQQAIAQGTAPPNISVTPYFRSLVGKTSTPDQFLGPLSVTGLQQDRFVRKTSGYLPEALFGFLDEVYKGSSAVLNDLLNIMAERIIQMDGAMQPVPLISLLAASNELPQEDDLRAFHDRFLLRIFVDRIQEKDNLVKLLKNGTPKLTTQITVADVMQAQAEVKQVVIPDAIFEAAVGIHFKLVGEGLTASDRRLLQAMDLVRAHAWLNGRQTATVADLAPLRHVYWETQDEIRKVHDVILEVVNPLGRQAREKLDMIIQAFKQVDEAGLRDEQGLPRDPSDPKARSARVEAAAEALPRIQDTIVELQDLAAKAQAEGFDVDPIQKALDKAGVIEDDLHNKYLRVSRRRQ